MDPPHRQGVDRIAADPQDESVQRLDQFQQNHDAHRSTVRAHRRDRDRARGRAAR
ncbi:hypothetical protein [Kitasatospora sp. NPDC058478]|uniref:hypothetical protein n=1 Tax=unclassified Kitasatospora TaxID=2633591 RepID=UPI003659738B